MCWHIGWNLALSIEILKIDTLKKINHTEPKTKWRKKKFSEVEFD